MWKFPGALALLVSLGLGSACPNVALGDPRFGGGYGGYKWNGMNWNPVPGGAARLAVAPDGTPWVINRQGSIFKRHHNNWRQLPGLARDIGIGADGRVWLVGTNPVPGGFGVYQWNGADWSPIEGGATNIAVGPSGVPMVANAEGRVFALEQAGPPMPPPPPGPPPMPPPPMPPPPAPVAYPLAPERFERMLRQVAEQPFADAKIQRLQDYLQPDTFFTTAQIVRLMQTSAFGGERVRIAVLLWPRVLDPENFPELIGQLTFESERQELRQKLRR